MKPTDLSTIRASLNGEEMTLDELHRRLAARQFPRRAPRLVATNTEPEATTKQAPSLRVVKEES